MTKFIAAILVFATIHGNANAASARPLRNAGWIDQSQLYGGFDPNSAEGNRAFWDNQTRHGH